MKPLSILKKAKTDTNFFTSAKINDRQGRISTITPYGAKIALTLPTEGNETNETQTQKTFSIMTLSPRKSRNKKTKTLNNETRSRFFESKPIERANLFEGLPFIGYDIFVRRDPVMQNIIFRDLLKILIDKSQTLKSALSDKNKLKKIFKTISNYRRNGFNKKLEETMTIIDIICNTILGDFSSSLQKLGVKPSPLQHKELLMNEFKNEQDALESNLSIYFGLIDFLRDSVEIFFIIRRQKERKIFEEDQCNDLIKFLTKARYNLGELIEDIRLFEKNLGQNVFQIKAKKNRDNFKSDQSPQNGRQGIIFDNDYQKRSKIALIAKIQKLNTLLQNKFNFSKNKFLTRESKVNLNTEKYDNEKNLLLSVKQFEKNRPIADNRKQIFLQNVLDPLNSPEMKMARKIARSLNLNFDL